MRKTVSTYSILLAVFMLAGSFFASAHAEVYQVANAAALFTGSRSTDFLFFADNKGIARFGCSGWRGDHLALNVSLGSSTIESASNRYFYKQMSSGNECAAVLKQTLDVAYSTPAKITIDLRFRDSTFEISIAD